MNTNKLNEILKQKEAEEAQQGKQETEMHLDDAARVKVLSPARLVMKRFVRNRLAIFGSILLIIMFVFCFLGPIFYPYGQKQVFYKYADQTQDYAFAKERTDYTGYAFDTSIEIPRAVASRMNSMIQTIEASGSGIYFINNEDAWYSAVQMGENVYALCQQPMQDVAAFGERTVLIGTYSMLSKEFTYEGEALDDGFVAAASALCKGAGGEFEYGGKTYTVVKGAQPKTFDVYGQSGAGFAYTGAAMDEAFETSVTAVTKTVSAEAPALLVYNDATYAVMGSEEDGYTVYQMGEPMPAQVYSRYVFSAYTLGTQFSDEFKCAALGALCSTGTFSVEGETYTIVDENGILTIKDAAGNGYAELTTFAINRYNGDDTMDYALKNAIIETIEDMEASSSKTGTLVHDLPQQDEKGAYVYNDDGELVYEEADLTVTKVRVGEYVVKSDLVTHLIDRYAKPSGTHLMGTDGDGFDVLARIMYGGRISLMVGFVVVIIETLLGTIMGGLAGYFGGVVDNLIMRLVDIFYCLPMMPIMIILGAMMDAQRMNAYVRLLVMMASLGIMGWAGVARLVRGQILSLREQEFMVAAEATGVRVRKRIFRHLVPNVMPQLIVTSTAGLGGIILTESTLSFLGLGVKHPLATWGTMINSVSTAAAMENYVHIWVPVGLLICLTVIAFNFVGDGLRDAFDPKSKQ